MWSSADVQQEALVALLTDALSASSPDANKPAARPLNQTDDLAIEVISAAQIDGL
jgi:hypothetical protein